MIECGLRTRLFHALSNPSSPPPHPHTCTPPHLHTQRLEVSHCDIWFIRFCLDYRHEMLILGNQVGKILVWDLTVDEPNKLKYSYHFSCYIIPVHHTCTPHITHLVSSPHTSHTPYHPLHTHHTPHTLSPLPPLHTLICLIHTLQPSTSLSTHITPTHLTDPTLYHIQSVSQPLDKSPSAKTERKDLRVQRS